MTLALSNISGAVIDDDEATGSITNTDPMPKAWMVRFGRTVGSQVVDAVSARLKGGRTPRVTIGGVALGGHPARVSSERNRGGGTQRQRTLAAGRESVYHGVESVFVKYSIPLRTTTPWTLLSRGCEKDRR